ncbi:hypothetical protein TNCV_526181 [Trichonephila clavipes]|nr:hypothetical protein TNCV_526181 [Trichonephila clavipes]
MRSWTWSSLARHGDEQQQHSATFNITEKALHEKQEQTGNGNSNTEMLCRQFTIVAGRKRSYRRIIDTGPPSYKVPNMCNCSPTNRALKSGKEPRRNFDTVPT